MLRVLKRTGMLLFLALTVIVFGACKKENTEQLSDSTEESVAASTELVSSDALLENSIQNQFYQMLQTETDREPLYTFFEENVSALNQTDTDSFVLGLIGFEDDSSKADYNRLKPYTDNMSMEMANFVSIMSHEQDTPSLDGRGSRVPLEDLLKNCRTLESHLSEYPDGITVKYGYNLYADLMTAAITGGYDEVSAVDNQYLSDDREHIDGKAIEAYNAFISENPDSKTAVILKKYLDALDNSKKTIDDEIKNFYADIYGTIKEEYGNTLKIN